MIQQINKTANNLYDILRLKGSARLSLQMVSHGEARGIAAGRADPNFKKQLTRGADAYIICPVNSNEMNPVQKTQVQPVLVVCP